mmetsp:Transcript_1234/g.3112  ORF Transcript_1234/g.3112 Transcript_1234/m.3112 type:complete len:457 (-) Transcript_1234:371-1741(-)
MDGTDTTAVTSHGTTCPTERPHDPRTAPFPCEMSNRMPVHGLATFAPGLNQLNVPPLDVIPAREPQFGTVATSGDHLPVGRSPGAVSEVGGVQPQDKNTTMDQAAEMLNNAALALKRRRRLAAADEVSGFVRTVYTLLSVCDEKIICWSDDGTKVVIKSPDVFALEICPKFFRHRNFNSFTRLLNMYQFHKVSSTRGESKQVCFSHPHFQRGREDLLPLVQRKGTQIMPEELMASELVDQSVLGAVAVLETALAPIHSQKGPSTQPPNDATAAAAVSAAAATIEPTCWMQRMNDLEAEVRELKKENDRLHELQKERDNLKNDLRAQGELLSSLSVQSKVYGALNSLAASFTPAPLDNKAALKSTSADVVPAMSLHAASQAAPASIADPRDVTGVLENMGGTSALAVMLLGMFANAALTQGLSGQHPAFAMTNSAVHQDASLSTMDDRPKAKKLRSA